jgi:integral membrane protein
VKLVRLLRTCAFWEATLFLLLLIATAVKYLVGHASAAVAILGSVHGTVFTVYLVLVLVVRSRLRWNLVMTLAILIAGFVPGGGYVVERWALSSARVDSIPGLAEGEAATTSRSRRSKPSGAAQGSAEHRPQPGEVSRPR